MNARLIFVCFSAIFLSVFADIRPVASQPVDEGTSFYIYDDERIPLLPSQRFLAVVADDFDDETLNPDVFAVTESPIAEMHGLVLIQRNDNVDQDTFDESSRQLGDGAQMGQTYAAGSVDLLLVNEFTIAFESAERAEQIIQETGIEVLRRSRSIDNHFMIAFPDSSPIEGLDKINELSGIEGVSYAYPNFTTIIPRDNRDRDENPSAELPSIPEPQEDVPYFEQLLQPLSVGWPDDWWFDYQRASGMDKIRAPEAWLATIGSCDLKIAVLDDGVDLDHPDLVDKIIAGWDFMDDDEVPEPLTTSAHGTAVTGVLGAMTNNSGLGVAGTIWGGEIMPYRIYFGSDSNEQLDPERARAGIEEAVYAGARVVNNSWSVPMNEITSYWYNIEPAIDDAIAGGSVLVFSVGNSSTEVNYPARLASSKDVIAVGFTDEQGVIRPNSNGGPDDYSVSVVAPGWYLETTDIAGTDGWDNQSNYFGDYYESFSDTSAATPYVSGAAALLLSWDPSASPEQIKAWIMNGAADPDVLTHGQQWGDGVLDIVTSINEIGVTDVSIAGSVVSAGASLEIGESATLDVSITRNGLPLSGALVRLQSNDATLASVSPENEYLVTNCNGIVTGTVTGEYSGTDQTTAFIQVEIYDKTDQVPVVVGEAQSIWEWLLIAAVMLAVLVALARVITNRQSRFRQPPQRFE